MRNRLFISGTTINQVESLEGRQLMSAAWMTSSFQLQGEDQPAVTMNLGHAGSPSAKAGSRHTVHDGAGRGRSHRRHGGAAAATIDVSSDPLFGPDGPSADDIRQGAAEDCYFLSALSETAQQDPGLIEQIVHQRRNGTYDVYFTESDGQVDDVHVNGQMPASNGRLTYAGLGQDNDTWVAVMEKAFTYFRNPAAAGSYSSINYGYPNESFADIGAVNIGDYGSDAMDSGTDLGDAIYGDLQSGRGVVITTPATSGVLVSSHVYSAVDAGTDESGNMMVEVRNPWGTDGPNSDGYQWVYADDIIGQGVTVTAADV
jgi:calpain family cysteine protease